MQKLWQIPERKMTKRKQNDISKYFVSKEKISYTTLDDQKCNKASLKSEDADWKNQWVDINGPQFNISTLILYKTLEEKKNIFEELEKQIAYLSDPQLTKIKVFGRWHDIPRKQAAYGNDGVTYTYSGIKIQCIPWSKAPILERLLEDVKTVSRVNYNFVLVNRYQDGRDKMGEHKDDEKELDPNAPIASLSFGEERDFIFKHQDLVRKTNKTEKYSNDEKLLHKMVLKNGMLLLMKAPTNQYWYHSLPARSIKSCSNTRINLTFRKIL